MRHMKKQRERVIVTVKNDKGLIVNLARYVKITKNPKKD